MTSLTLVRRIAARPSIVFDALTTPEGIASWWRPDDGPVVAAHSDVRVGGNYRVRFRTVDGLEHEARGQYLELIKPGRLVMSFEWAEGGESDKEESNISRVEVDLRAVDQGTELVFTHTHLASDASKETHTGGWSIALDHLVRIFAPQLNSSSENRTHDFQSPTIQRA